GGSRRTRPKRDWSSDVCSSDLDVQLDHGCLLGQALRDPLAQRQGPPEVGEDDGGALLLGQPRGGEGDGRLGEYPGDQDLLALEKIGSASWRGGGGRAVGRRAWE